jgi:uncharacterized protein
VYFFSLDAARSLAVVAAHAFLNLPYYAADMTVDHRAGAVRYTSSRLTTEPAEFKASYQPTSDRFVAPEGSIEYFLTERYCLYNHHHSGSPYRLDIHHRPWPLQTARATITTNTMAAASGLTLRGEPELLHFAGRQDMVAWAPASIRA